MLRIYNCPQATAFFPPQNSPSNASTRLARLRRTALPPWPGASATRRVPRPGSPVPHDPERRAAFFRQIRRGPRLPPATGPRVGGTAQAQPLGLRHPTELAQAGHHISINALTLLLREEGFARLPRRRDEERPTAIKAETAEVADVRRLDLSPRSFRTAAAGLFLFVPLLEGIDLKRVVEAGRLPGSKMIPAEQAVRSLLALKLLGTERKSHVMDLVFDPAIALFAGLNVVPKRSYLAAYSSRVDHRANVRLMDSVRATREGRLAAWQPLDLDFHTVPPTPLPSRWRSTTFQP